MRCLALEVCEILPSLLRDDRRFVIVMTGCCSKGIEGIPKQDRDELNLCSKISAEQVAPSIASVLADPRQKLRLQHGLVSIRVLRHGVSMPHSCDHDRPSPEANLPRGTGILPAITRACPEPVEGRLALAVAGLSSPWGNDTM